MTLPGVPLVIVTLPARTVSEAKAELVEADRAGADVAEIRFDRWSLEEREKMDGLFPAPLPLLATLRSTAEGGEGPTSASDRRAWGQRVGSLPFAFVDVEVDRDGLEGLGPSPGPASPTLILSVHLPEGASPQSVHQRLEQLDPSRGIAKVVVPAGVRMTLQELVPELPPPGILRYVVHTTGASGPLLRAWARRLGFAAVYSSLPEVRRGAAPASVEPSQIPADRLRPFLEADPPAPLFAVVGSPIGYSLSPALHHAWMRAGGRIGLYVALEIDRDTDLAESLEPLGRGGFRGLNVTHPLKEVALRLADRVLPGAEACGCANLLTFENGEVEAENTDLLAVLRRLGELERDGVWGHGDDLLVLGCGGAARAALAAVRSMGGRARVLARNRVRAGPVAASFGAALAEPADARSVPLVVNATTVGRDRRSRLELDLEPWVGPTTYLLDFVYRPESRVLEEVAQGRGAAYEDGRRLLGYSAAASFERWWGTTLSDRAILDALEAAG